MNLKELIFQRDSLCLFDYDLTLYSYKEAHVLHSMDIYISEFVQQTFACDFIQANTIRKEYWKKYGTTLAGLQKHKGCDPQEYFDYIHSGLAIQKPQLNEVLAKFLESLPNNPWIFTNGRADWAQMGLDSMGLTFDPQRILDIEYFGWYGKPHPKPYEMVINRLPKMKNVIFFDDKEENLLAAQKYEWITVLVGPNSPINPNINFHIRELAEVYEEDLCLRP